MSRPFPVIAIEEHYWDHELVSHLTGAEGTRSPAMLERLYDFGGVRLAEMDAAGIDMQVLSHGAPSRQKLPPHIAPKLIAGVNDRLAAAIKPYPTRFAAFAALPTAAPEAAERLAADFRIRFGTPLHPIGRITSGPGLVWLRNGKPEPLDWHGFEHY